MVGVEKVVVEEVLHYLEVHCVLHHLANLHQVGDRAVVANHVLLILLVQREYELRLPSTGKLAFQN